MPDIDIRDLTLLPGTLRRLWPRNTPTIRDQLACPPGSHRSLESGGCVPDTPPPPPVLNTVPTPPPAPSTRDTSRDRPPKNEAFLPPIPPPVIVQPPPPVVPPPVASPAPFPDATTSLPRAPRGTVRTTGVLNPLLSVGGVLAWVLGTLVFGPYFTGTTRDYERELERTSTRGPPRRGRPRGRTSEDLPPYYRYEGPWPYPPGTPLPGPIPFPRRTPSGPGTQPRAPTTRLPSPAQPRALPRTRPTVRGLPAPAGWTLGDPLPGVGYDPYTVAPPTPSPRTRPRSTPRTRNPVRLPVWWPVSDPVRLPGVAPRRTTPLTPQQPTSSPRPRAPLTPQQPFNPLTPLQDPVPLSQPQGLRKPTSANPCTTERTARRRRQQDCKRYTTKTIRVCADK